MIEAAKSKLAEALKTREEARKALLSSPDFGEIEATRAERVAVKRKIIDLEGQRVALLNRDENTSTKEIDNDLMLEKMKLVRLNTRFDELRAPHNERIVVAQIGVNAARNELNDLQTAETVISLNALSDDELEAKRHELESDISARRQFKRAVTQAIALRHRRNEVARIASNLSDAEKAELRKRLDEENDA